MNYDSKLKGVCILSAEDNEVNRIVMEHILAEQDLPFLLVENGVQALEAWRELQPAIILMDISMPVMNGMEAMRAIRLEEEKTGRHVPIIAVTAHAGSGDREKCLSSGADDYLTKPLSPPVLLDKISQVLAGYKPTLQIVASA